MKSRGEALAVALAALSLAGCGHDTQTSTITTSTARGTLVANPPPRLASLSRDALTANLTATTAGNQLVNGLLTPSGFAPRCGVDFYYFTYWTVDATGKPASATGSLMVPTGDSNAQLPVGTGFLQSCTGARPVVLYAHGTASDKSYNIANIADTSNPANGEAALLAAEFASQGFIVVAPNYVGYDTSSSAYHPFLNADQQSGDMIDALSAARQALPNTFTPGTTDGGFLFVTGYSQGGYVALATVRALQDAGTPATASAPMSGPYALEAFGDIMFLGKVDVGGTVFAPLIARSYQEAYGNLYQQPSDLFESAYTGAATLLPSTQTLAELFGTGLLPQTALFNSTGPTAAELAAYGPLAPTLEQVLAVPAGTFGFGDPDLITNGYRAGYVADALLHPDGWTETLLCQSQSPLCTQAAAGAIPATGPGFGLRQDLLVNDLRHATDQPGVDWVPQSPTLLCGGENDPTVFYPVNTTAIASYWTGLLPAGYVSPLGTGLVTVLDVDSTPLAAACTADSTPGSCDPFAALKVGFQQTYQGEIASAGQAQALQDYHGTLVPPFCATAALGFFEKVLASATAGAF